MQVVGSLDWQSRQQATARTYALAAACSACLTPWMLSSNGELKFSDFAGLRRHNLVGSDAAWSEHAKRPAARCRVEREATVLSERDLGDELPVGIEQPGVAGRHRRAAACHVPLHDRLVTGAIPDLDPAGRSAAAASRCLFRSAHLPSPSSIGTLTKDPYSV